MAESPKRKFIVVLRTAPPLAIECSDWWLDSRMPVYRFFDSYGTSEHKDDRDVAVLSALEVVGVVPADRYSPLPAPNQALQQTGAASLVSGTSSSLSGPGC